MIPWPVATFNTALRVALSTDARALRYRAQLEGLVHMHRYAPTVVLLSLLLACASCPAAETDLAPGLVGAYYQLTGDVEDFPSLPASRKPTFVRVDKQVHFDDVGDEEFHGTKLVENFYARWTGVIRVDTPGRYTFFTTSDDGSRLLIGDNPVVNNGGPHAMIEKSGTIELSPGTHPIRIEYFQGGGGKGCKVAWQAPGGKREPLPPTVLFHAKSDESIPWDKLAWEKRKSAPPGKFSFTDYGPYYSATVKGPQGNVALKGLVIKLGTKEKPANVCFDTELMRLAFAWTDGWLKLPKGRDGLEGQPTVEGATAFQSKARSPGWAKGEQFNDPREKPFGPLPPEWADYKGLYLNGDKAVLSYTVGSAEILELPAFTHKDGLDVFTRTLSVTGSSQPQKMLLFEQDGPGSIQDNVAVIKKDGACVAAGIAHAPPGTQWQIIGPRVHLTLPPMSGRTTFQILLWRGAEADLQKFKDLVSTTPKPIDPATLTKGGPRRWNEPVVTKGTPGNEKGAYVMDTLAVPYDNPHQSYMRLTGLDFFNDGRAAICTMDGDVWIVSGIDEKLDKLTWKRFAAGLSHTTGLKVVDGKVYTLGRDQITRLHDLNDDGEADFYESFNNDCHVQLFYHEFALDLHRDRDGNFYYMKGAALGLTPTVHNGTMLRVSKDGKKLDVVAVGFRAPNGMGVGPNGELTAGDNQGEWTPLCPINWIKPGGFYGYVQDHYPHAQPTSPRERPLCWLPMETDNSAGSQVWATSDRWGPLGGRMLHLSYGKCRLYAVMMEEVNGVMQGGVVGFPFKFVSGGMRGAFNPADGQLYVVGMKGWQTDANLDGCLHRVRYTGKAANMPLDLRVLKDGVAITFTEPLDAASAGDPDGYAVEWFNVKRTKGYGSKEYTISDPEKVGREPVDVTNVEVSSDRKTVTMKIPEIRPVTNMIIAFKIKSADGVVIEHEIANTINEVPR